MGERSFEVLIEDLFAGLAALFELAIYGAGILIAIYILALIVFWIIESTEEHGQLKTGIKVLAGIIALGLMYHDAAFWFPVVVSSLFGIPLLLLLLPAIKESLIAPTMREKWKLLIATWPLIGGVTFMVFLALFMQNFFIELA